MEKTRELNGGDAVNWYYRGEGAANMVLAYQGSDPVLVGKVVRVKKLASDSKHVKEASTAIESGKPVLEDEEQRLWAKWPSVATATSVDSLIQAYARDIMSPLLGHELVDPGVLVHVSSEFLETVTHNVLHARPLSRVTASQIDTRSNTALLISDHTMFLPPTDTEECSLSSISVEIKPKCGFLPSSSFIAAENSVKKEVPRFTMHQFLKLLEGQVRLVSTYSPLDLFSGSLERIGHAVCELFDHPQSNLRVFVGGTMVDMGAAACSQDPSLTNWHGLREALKCCLSYEVEEDAIDVLKQLVVQSLYETEAMSNLLAAQKRDTYDIEGAIHAYNKLCVGSSDEPGKGGSVMDKGDDSSRALKEGACFFGSLSMEEFRQIVRDYLIAATAKDCSLMLTFQQVSDSAEAADARAHEHKVLCSGKTGKFFLYKIRFVDLDLKPLRKMPYYYHLDQAIVKAYVAATPTGTCL